MKNEKAVNREGDVLLITIRISPWLTRALRDQPGCQERLVPGDVAPSDHPCSVGHVDPEEEYIHGPPSPWGEDHAIGKSEEVFPGKRRKIMIGREGPKSPEKASKVIAFKKQH